MPRAGFTTIAADAPYLEIIVITLVANARYLLMSCVLSQKFAPATSVWHRIAVGFDVTDEIFGITVARKGTINPYYNYGAMAVALPGWSVGTALGVMAGSVLPVNLISGLSVALYGMFLAIIIPPAREDPVVARLVAISFAASFVLGIIATNMSEGTRTIILTILIAGTAAYIYPHRE